MRTVIRCVLNGTLPFDSTEGFSSPEHMESAKQGNLSALQTPESSCIFPLREVYGLYFFFFSAHSAFIVLLGDDKDMFLGTPSPPPKTYTVEEESSCKQISYKYTLVSALLGILV